VQLHAGRGQIILGMIWVLTSISEKQRQDSNALREDYFQRL
jgi:hypothetical protein